jgi:hypothetical protein
MIIIKFFSSFGTNDGCIEAYTRVSELSKDPMFNTCYRFTTKDDYTHAIILNTAMPNLNIPKKNVIGLAFEPNVFLNLTSQFVEYAKKNIGVYLIGDKRSLPDPFIEHFSYMWHTTPLLELPIKSNKMSLMVSSNLLTEGHKYRHTICRNILSSNLPIDIYGNGCKYYSNIKDSRIKGNFESKEPYLHYQFHIAIENVETPHYFSEKIMDALVCNTIPVYLGCKNIDVYFPNSVIHLTHDINIDMNILVDICNNPNKYIKPINVEQVKKTISFTNIVQKYIDI